MRAAAPEYAFRFGEPLRGRYGRLVLAPQPVGPLSLPSGRLVACDPLTDLDAAPLAIELPPGEHPVELSIARLPGDDYRVAYAALLVSAEPAVSWQPAPPVAAGGVRRPDDANGFGVDSATAAYLDANTREPLHRWAERDREWVEQVADRLAAGYVPTWSWAWVEIPASGGLTFLAFSSGMGDGVYTTHVGLDAAGLPCAVVTDFGLVTGPVATPAAAGEARPWWRFWDPAGGA